MSREEAIKTALWLYEYDNPGISVYQYGDNFEPKTIEEDPGSGFFVGSVFECSDGGGVFVLA
jgi:hypothetical protein